MVETFSGEKNVSNGALCAVVFNSVEIITFEFNL